jgi:hypothetical protein
MVSATQSKPSSVASSNKPAASSSPQKSPQERKVERAAKKSANFKKLAAKRMTRTLKMLDGVAALSNRNSYSYEPAHVEKILTALETKVKAIRESFNSTAAQSSGFTL